MRSPRDDCWLAAMRAGRLPVARTVLKPALARRRAHRCEAGARQDGAAARLRARSFARGVGLRPRQGAVWNQRRKRGGKAVDPWTGSRCCPLGSNGGKAGCGAWRGSLRTALVRRSTRVRRSWGWPSQWRLMHLDGRRVPLRVAGMRRLRCAARRQPFVAWWWGQSRANPSLPPFSQFQGNFQRILGPAPPGLSPPPKSSGPIKAIPPATLLRRTGKASGN